MLPIDIGGVAVSSLLCVATIVTLKLSLRRKPYSRPLLRQTPNSPSCWEHFKFLILRFTLLQAFVIRTAHLKLNQLLSIAMFSILSFSLQTCYYWGWAVGSLLGMLLFLMAEAAVVHSEMQEEDVEDARRLRWRRPCLYAVYAVATVLGFCYVAWSFVYTQTVWPVFGLNLGVMILSDQLVGRVCLSFILGVATKQWDVMLELRERYLEFEKPTEAAVGEDKQISAEPASPSKKRRLFPSPSKIPKANKPVQQPSMMQSKTQSRPYEMDSMVNILEMSQKKRIPKARLPPMRPFTQSEVEIFERSDANKFETPVRLSKKRQSNQMLMSDIVKNIDDRVEPDIQELPAKYMNSRSRRNSNIREQDISSILEKQCDNKDDNRAEDNIKQLETYNHLSNQQKSHILNTPVMAESQNVPSNLEPAGTVELQSLNTIELNSKLSGRNRHPAQSPRDIIPKCHIQDQNAIFDEDPKRRNWLGSSNKRSIQNIEEVLEEEDPQSGPFQIVENADGEFDEDQVPDNRARTLDQPIRLEIRASRQDDLLMGHRNSVLEIREDDAQQLEEVDLNSPIKQKRNSPQKAKQAITVSAKQKKKKNRKRDLRDLRKLNNGSPYLEYLPNMLNKQVEQKDKDKRASLKQVGRQLLKENLEDTKKGKSARRINIEQTHYFQVNELNNNQNRCPQDIVEDF